MAHLATGKPAPQEWIEFVLLDRFKWPIEYARALSLEDGLQLITMMSAEAKVNRSKRG